MCQRYWFLLQFNQTHMPTSDYSLWGCPDTNLLHWSSLLSNQLFKFKRNSTFIYWLSSSKLRSKNRLQHASLQLRPRKLHQFDNSSCHGMDLQSRKPIMSTSYSQLIVTMLSRYTPSLSMEVALLSALRCPLLTWQLDTIHHLTWQSHQFWQRFKSVPLRVSMLNEYVIYQILCVIRNFWLILWFFQFNKCYMGL